MQRLLLKLEAMPEGHFGSVLKPHSSLFAELINKLNFLDEEEQDLANSSMNPFGDPEAAEFNPFGDPDVEGNCFGLQESLLHGAAS